MAEKLLFEIDISNEGAVKKTANLRTELTKLREQRKQLNKAIRDGTGDEKKNADELARLELQIKSTSKELRAQERIASTNAGTLDRQRAVLGKLKKEYGSFRVGIDGTERDLKQLQGQIRDLTIEISEQEQAVGVFSRNVGNYTNSIKDAFSQSFSGISSLSGALASGPALVGAAVAGIGAGVSQLVDFSKEIKKTRDEVQQLTGAVGDDLTQFTSLIRSTSSTFETDFNEQLRATNTLAQQLGISFSEADSLISQGLAAGANVSGDFLGVIQEYPAQIQEAGLSAEEFISIYTQSVQDGVFSDKGIDAIKEAKLRLQELPPATQDALRGIGLNATTIQSEIQNGSKTTFDVIQEVSDAIATLPPGSQEAAVAVADIFGGPGEDAGRQFIETLGEIDGGLQGLVDQAGNAADQQLRLKQANDLIETSFGQLLGGAGDFFKEVEIGAKQFVGEFLQEGLRVGVDLINFFIELYNESLIFRGAIQSIRTGFENVGAVAGAVFDFFINGFETVGSLIKAVFTREFSRIPDILSEGFTETLNITEDLGSEIGNNIRDGINKGLRDKVELVSLSSSETTEVENSYRVLGEKTAKAFNEGVSSQAPQSLGGGQDFSSLGPIGSQVDDILGDQVIAKLEEQAIKIEQVEQRKRAARQLTAEDLENISKGEIGTFSAIADASSNLADIIISNTEEESAARKRGESLKKAAALTALGINRGIALSEVLKAAQAISASAPPATIPLGIAYGVAQGAAIVAQFASQASEIIGLNSGGIIPGSGPNRDSVYAHLTPGEAVMTRDAVSMFGPQLSYMNQLAGGAAFFPTAPKTSFATGGIATAAAASAQQAQQQAALQLAISKIKVIATIEDINRVGNRVRITESRANI